MERDEKGHFKKGVTPDGAVPFSEGVAKEMQLRSAAKRKENRTLAEVVRAALAEKAAKGSEMTKLEYLALKALENHAQGDVTFRDLRELQKLLGEDIKTVNINGPLIVSQEEIDTLSKWASKE